jgi:hypothetical protein
MKEKFMTYYGPSFLTSMTLDAAHAKESELKPTLDGILHTHGYETFQAPVVAQIRQGDLPAIFPNKRLHNNPVAIVCLPDWMENDLWPLVISPLEVRNQLSSDLMTSATCLTVTGHAHELHIDAQMMMQTLRGIGKNGLHLLFICGDHVWIVQHRVDAAWSHELGAAMMGAGENYRPYRLFSDAELAAAARKCEEGKQANETMSFWRPEVLYKSRTGSST